ncbi:MAG: sulfatase-like hydrolase/transferase [Cyclobacteriaceae bacterium]|uniref:sulfatase family protein n=1 Tax=Reichenbachiella sp. TaxID=2184521 RepID=UPI0032631C7A
MRYKSIPIWECKWAPLLWLLLASCGQSAQEKITGKASPPNIVFIFADDWGWGDLGAHGHPFIKTPNIDRMALEGTDFYRFTAASSVGSPSRTAVLTGQFPARHNVNASFSGIPINLRRNMPDWLDPEAILLPRLLQQNGYRTGHFGKWQLTNSIINDAPSAESYGFDTYGTFNCSGVQMPFYEDAEQSITFIKQAVSDEVPFYVNLWIHEPHIPHHAIPKYEKDFLHLENDKDRVYSSVIFHADERIGKVLDVLDQLEVAKNTLVVFSSDNGPARNSRKREMSFVSDPATGIGYNIAASTGTTGGRRGYKASLFEGGIGVPFIARWPGVIPAGKIDSTSLISAVDLLPTFCEIGDVNLPENYHADGLSQLKTLGGIPYPKRSKPLFWKAFSRNISEDNPDHWGSYAIVDKNWKLIANKDLTYVELYDIQADVHEENDLKEKYPEIVMSLLEQIQEWEMTLPKKPNPKLFSKERSYSSE